MKRLIQMAAAALSLSACATFPSVPAAPVEVANRTTLDETGDRGVQLAYKAARIAMETLVDAGKIKGANALRVDALNTKAFQLSQAVHKAYLAGNSTSYTAAKDQAMAAVAEFLAALK